MDYSTRTRPELLALCKERGLSGAGTTEDLIERLEAQDAEAAGKGVDDDPMADDDAADVEPAPAAAPAEAPQKAAPGAAPAADVPDGSQADATAKPNDRTAAPDPKVKEGVTGNVYRFEFYASRHVDDELHRHFIAETHHNARAAGHSTKGYPTVGHRVRTDADAAGKPTVVYEVYLSGSKPNGLRRP